ncbi:MAG: hypothetical protein HOE48_20790 [Candidatus Latescibacteria bacterium]|nr:hypothetical protein [Candidatus Latescibacterota bacterium]
MKVSKMLLMIGLFWATPISAQITVNTLTEMQRGEVPSSDTPAISTAYNQVNIDYTQKGFQVGLRAEVYNTWGADREVYEITQKYARWSHKGFRLEVGNYNAILGRGLTLRAFELPGVILESQLYRLRYAPTQDMEGAYASWTGQYLEAKALIGQPAVGDIPPGATTGNPPRDIARRENWISGGELAVRPIYAVRLGGTAIHINPEDPNEDPNGAWSGFADLDLSPLLGTTGLYGSFYGEYAKRASGPDGHALYLSGNLGGSRLGLSVEYKDYEDMALRFNDPPSLIREHTAFLLNRATHVLLTVNEKGYQTEATYSQPDLGTFTANVTYAENALGPTITTIFKERHLAFDLEKFTDFSLGVFFNWGRDDLEGINKRRIAGFIAEKTSLSGHTFGVDVQHQRASRPFGDPMNFNDTYGLLSWQHPKGFGAALIVDHTSDPFEVDRPETFDIETGRRTFWSLNLNARISTHYDAALFAGERRGGTACTSGTCYQVLPFKGVEMRINTYF